MTRYATLILSLLLFTTLAAGEEVEKYEIGLVIEPGQYIRYEVEDTTRTLTSDPATKQAIIISITTEKDSRRVALSRKGEWVTLAEQEAFKKMRVDEATAHGMPLDQSIVNNSKVEQLRKHRLESDIFYRKVVGVNGQPDPSQSGGEDMSSVLNTVAQNIAFIPPREVTMLEEWNREVKVGSYTAVYDYEVLKTYEVDGRTIVNVKGEVYFRDLSNNDPLNVVREMSFKLDFDTERKTLHSSQLRFVAGLKKSGKIVERTNTIRRNLASFSTVGEAAREKLKTQMDSIAMAKEAVELEQFDEAYMRLKAVVEEGTLFLSGAKQFLRDRVFNDWKVEGRQVDKFWFTEWINSSGYSAKDARGDVVVLAFFDPAISSSTRIWRPFDDWREHFVPQGARLIAVSAAEPQEVKKYVNELKIDHTVACDGDYLMLNYFQVSVVPTFIVLDKAGKVALKVVGKREMYKVHKKLEEYFGPIE